MIARQPLLIARFIVLSMLIGIAAALPGCAPRRVAGPAPSAGRPPASLPEAVPLSSKRAAPTSTSETQPSNAGSSPAAEKGAVEPEVIVGVLEEWASSG